MSSTTAYIENIFGLPTRNAQALTLYALEIGIPDNDRLYNAIQHGYVSATLERDFGSGIAGTLGDAGEWRVQMSGTASARPALSERLSLWEAAFGQIDFH